MTRPSRHPAFDAILPTPFGALGIVVDCEALVGVHFLPPGTPGQAGSGALSREACAQLQAYLRDPAFRFALPLRARGSPFQKRVWDSISAIPPGQVRRYGELSSALGSAARAVGQACGANPLPVVVPCHRVVSASGIGGFANARDGYLLDTKRWLLRHEGAPLR